MSLRREDIEIRNYLAHKVHCNIGKDEETKETPLNSTHSISCTHHSQHAKGLPSCMILAWKL